MHHFETKLWPHCFLFGYLSCLSQVQFQFLGVFTGGKMIVYDSYGTHRTASITNSLLGDTLTDRHYLHSRCHAMTKAVRCRCRKFDPSSASYSDVSFVDRTAAEPRLQLIRRRNATQENARRRATQ